LGSVSKGEGTSAVGRAAGGAYIAFVVRRLTDAIKDPQGSVAPAGAGDGSPREVAGKMVPAYT